MYTERFDALAIKDRRNHVSISKIILRRLTCFNGWEKHLYTGEKQYISLITRKLLSFSNTLRFRLNFAFFELTGFRIPPAPGEFF